MLLAAELLIITGTVEFRLATDARNYLYRGYNPSHYDRGYHYRRAEEVGGRQRLGWTCWALALVLALADLGFNVSYMWDLTGQALLSGLAGGFFTALLAGLSVLLAHAYEYHHLQLKESRKAAQHVQAGPGYVPYAGSPAPPEAATADLPAPRPPAEPEPEPVPEPVPEPEPELDPPPVEPPKPRKLLPPRTQLKALIGGQSFLLDEENTVGRAKANSIVLSDPSVAEFHARLSWNGRTWEIVDLGSRDGTHIKGSRLPPDQPTPVSVGTAVRFGKLEMVLDVHIGLPR